MIALCASLNIMEKKQFDPIKKTRLDLMVSMIGDFIIENDRMPRTHEIAEMLNRSKSTVIIWLRQAKELNLIDWSMADRFYSVKGIYFEDKRK